MKKTTKTKLETLTASAMESLEFIANARKVEEDDIFAVAFEAIDSVVYSADIFDTLEEVVGCYAAEEASQYLDSLELAKAFQHFANYADASYTFAELVESFDEAFADEFEAALTAIEIGARIALESHLIEEVEQLAKQLNEQREAEEAERAELEALAPRVDSLAWFYALDYKAEHAQPEIWRKRIKLEDWTAIQLHQVEGAALVTWRASEAFEVTTLADAESYDISKQYEAHKLANWCDSNALVIVEFHGLKTVWRVGRLVRDLLATESDYNTIESIKYDNANNLTQIKTTRGTIQLTKYTR